MNRLRYLRAVNCSTLQSSLQYQTMQVVFSAEEMHHFKLRSLSLIQRLMKEMRCYQIRKQIELVRPHLWTEKWNQMSYCDFLLKRVSYLPNQRYKDHPHRMLALF